MGRQNCSVWIATVKGRQYVRFRLGDERQRHLGPIEQVKMLVDKLNALGINGAGIPVTPNDIKLAVRAKEMARDETMIQKVREWVHNNKAWVKEGASKLSDKDPRDIKLSDIDVNVLGRTVALDVWYGRCNNVMGCSVVIATMWNYIRKMADFAYMWMWRYGDNYLWLEVLKVRDELVEELKRAAQRYQ